MTRPAGSLPAWLVLLPRLLISLLLLGMLAACAGQHAADIDANAPQQAAQYQARAPGHYLPPGPQGDPWGPYIREAAKRFDIPEEWVRAVMHVESGGHEYRDGHLITSGAGAMGLMQVMPDTYAELRERYGLGPDPYDPHDNIMAGVAYMRELYDIYGTPAFLAAYNGGPWRLDDYLADERPLPNETRHYVAMIAPEIAGIYPVHRSPARAYAMNRLPDDIPPGLRDGEVRLASARHSARHRHRHERMIARATERRHRGHAARPVELAMAPPLPPPEPPHRRGGFHLITPAQAAETDGSQRDAGSDWAVQVGAFSTRREAEHAADHAKVRVHLRASRTMVESVRTRHAKLWRARLTGISHHAAEAACHKLTRAHAGCMVISPESRS